MRDTLSSNAEALLVDIYLVPKKKNHSALHELRIEDHLIALANFAVDINEYIHQFSLCNTKSVNDDNMNSSSIDRHCRRYPWMSGGDGPVFGIHCSSSCNVNVDEPCDHSLSNASPVGSMIPHLRAICRYGICVNDEWYLIGLILQFLEGESVQQYALYRIAVECWDMDDGQILMIEAAHHIPSWVDEIGPTHCNHRCWIVAPTEDSRRNTASLQLIQPVHQHGMIAPTPVLLSDALDLLGGSNSVSHCILENAPPAMEAAIRDRIYKNSTMDCMQVHCAAVVLPRTVAQAFHDRPDLIAAACRMFVENIHCPMKHTIRRPEDYVLGQTEDWVWTPLSFSRTAYAMLRTITCKPDWINEDVVAPQVLASKLEIKRLQRQCAVEATPHLRYGLQLGVRLLAGLHHCLKTPASKNVDAAVPSYHASYSDSERRLLLYWSHIDKRCRVGSVEVSDPDKNKDWIAESWYAGPNASQYDVTAMLKCPVFHPEIESCLTPLSFPGIELAKQTRNALLNTSSRRTVPFTTHPPRYCDVDDDSWMWALSTSKDQLLSSKNCSIASDDASTFQKNAKSSPSWPSNCKFNGTSSSPTSDSITPLFDEVVDSMQTFMTGLSTLEGVETKTTAADSVATPIDSTLFINILHTSLQSKSAQELSDHIYHFRRSVPLDDRFFSKEDYTLMEPSDSDYDEDDCDTQNYSNDLNLEDLMNAMDEELRKSTSCRGLDDIEITRNHSDTDDIAQKTHILSNMLKSLDAAAGNPGPIRNILQEMGCEISPVANDDNDSSDFA